MAMYNFIADDKVAGALIPLSDLVEKMRLDEVGSWRFRAVKLIGCGQPFGMTVDAFEARTRQDSIGLEVSDHDFKAFLKVDFQIVDGEVEAWTDRVPATCMVTLNCEDASQWEIATDRPDLAQRFLREGFPRKEN